VGAGQLLGDHTCKGVRACVQVGLWRGRRVHLSACASASAHVCDACVCVDRCFVNTRYAP
jgi:hypothetical protein